MPKTPRKSKIEYKAEAFAQKYIKNGYNGTQAVKELYKPKNDNVARNIASENLSKPIFKRAIEQAMEDAGLTDDFASKILRRNAEQTKNYAASNTALDIQHRIKGNYAPEKSAHLNINITPEQAELELKNLLNAI